MAFPLEFEIPGSGLGGQPGGTSGPSNPNIGPSIWINNTCQQVNGVPSNLQYYYNLFNPNEYFFSKVGNNYYLRVSLGLKVGDLMPNTFFYFYDIQGKKHYRQEIRIRLISLPAPNAPSILNYEIIIWGVPLEVSEFSVPFACKRPPVQQTGPSTPGTGNGPWWDPYNCVFITSEQVLLISYGILNTRVAQHTGGNNGAIYTVYFYNRAFNGWYSRSVYIPYPGAPYSVPFYENGVKASPSPAVSQITCVPPVSNQGPFSSTGNEIINLGSTSGPVVQSGDGVNTGLGFGTGMGSGLGSAGVFTSNDPFNPVPSGPGINTNLGVGIGQGVGVTPGGPGPNGDFIEVTGGGSTGGGDNNPDFDPCQALINNPTAYEDCKCNQDPQYCITPFDPIPPQDIYDLSLDPICPTPGYGGYLDPVQGDYVIKGGYIQYVGNVDPNSPVFKSLGPQGQNIFIARGWQVYNGPVVNSYSDWVRFAPTTVTYANISIGGLLVLENRLGYAAAPQNANIYYIFEPVPDVSAQETDCNSGSPNGITIRSRIGTLNTVLGTNVDPNAVMYELRNVPLFPNALGYIIVEDTFYAVIRKVKPVVPVFRPPTPGGPPIAPPPPPPSTGGPVIPPVVIEPPIQGPEERKRPPRDLGKVFTQLEKPIVKKVTETFGLWSENIGNLTSFFTCSYYDTSSPDWTRSYYTVFNKKCDDVCSEPQFDIAYGDDLGSGSFDLGGWDYETPTNAVYSQYRLTLLPKNQKKFNIAGKESNRIYVINVKKSRMGDRFDEGNWELNLHHLSESFENVDGFITRKTNLRSGGRALRLIDDSNISSPTSSFGGDFYNIVSGSLEQGVYNPSNKKVFGHVYPNHGIIILDANKLDLSASFLTYNGIYPYGPSEGSLVDNPTKLFMSISGAAKLVDSTGDTLGFKARRTKTFYDRYFFINVKNYEYNYSNNPTYVTGSEGEIKPEFRDQNNVYISSVGLYDRVGNLVAVGKISKPVFKSSTEEALFTVRLRY